MKHETKMSPYEFRLFWTAVILALILFWSLVIRFAIRFAVGP